MKLPRRNFLHLVAGAAALPAMSQIAWAQAYPSRPVRIIVGFAAGSSPDTTARLVGQALSTRLGQQFIVENRPGAGTNIATEAVVRAPPDGYTLLWVTAVNAINATLYDKLNFNFIRDIEPVTAVVRLPNIMVVHPSVPAKSVPEFIAYAKANPGRINMAYSTSGGTDHLAGELFKIMAGVDMVGVPYHLTGSSPTPKAIGIDEVAALAASAEKFDGAAMTLTLWRTRSAASSGSRSSRSSAQRYSIVTLR